MKTPVWWKLCLFVLVLATSLPGCAPVTEAQAPPPASAGNPDKLRVLILPYLAYAPFFIADAEGFFAGQNLEVEFVRMERTSEAMPALAQGQLDVAAGLIDASTLNAIARGTNIKYVADKGYIESGVCSYTGYVARKALLEGGKLDDLQNVKGMKIATEPGSISEFILDQILSDAGLSSLDAELLPMPQASRLEALGSGAIDIAGMAEPWIYRTQQAGYGELWQPWEEHVPGQHLSLIMYGPSLLDAKREIGVRFMTAYLQAMRQYLEGKTDRNVEIVAQYTQLKPEEVRAACWQPMMPDGAIDPQSILDFQAWAVEKGYLKASLATDQFLDLSFISEAARALAPE